MTTYRRTKIDGATYFFTVNCAQRHGNHLLLVTPDAVTKDHFVIVGAVNPDHHTAKAQKDSGTGEPDEKQVRQLFGDDLNEALAA